LLTLTIGAALLARAHLHRWPGWALDAMLVALQLWLLPAPPLSVDAALAPAWLGAALLLFAGSLALCRSPVGPYLARVARQAATLPAATLARAVRWQALVALHEELIWRVILQSALTQALGAGAAVPLVALAFCRWHRFNGAGARKRAELLAFALALGAAYAVSGDPVLPFLMHFVRNLLITIHHVEVR
jgi:membrane protease YdiL (CAAX protease family)